MALRKSAEEFVEEASSRVEHVRPERAAEQVRSGEVMLLDVREPDEWEAGHVAEAVHIPRGWLELAADPTTEHADERFELDRRILVHCAKGNRSALAAATLNEMGYRADNVEGGFEAWEEAGLTVERGVATHPPGSRR
jgi:rhodanese-related sulfurtransferase